MSKFSTNSDFVPPNLVIRLLGTQAEHFMTASDLGMSKRKFECTLPYFRFDTMGFPQFTEGAVDRSFDEFVLFVRKGKVEPKKILIPFHAEVFVRGQSVVLEAEKPVFLLSPRKYMKGAEEFLRSVANGNGDRRLLDPTHLAQGVFQNEIEELWGPRRPALKPVIGGYDLQNHFFYFIGPEWVRAMQVLFGVPDPQRLVKKEDRPASDPLAHDFFLAAEGDDELDDDLAGASEEDEMEARALKGSSGPAPQ